MIIISAVFVTYKTALSIRPASRRCPSRARIVCVLLKLQSEFSYGFTVGRRYFLPSGNKTNFMKRKLVGYPIFDSVQKKNTNKKYRYAPENTRTFTTTVHVE